MAGEDATESAGDSLVAGSGLRNLILSLTREDGFPMGNGARREHLREDVPDLSENGCNGDVLLRLWHRKTPRAC